MQRREPTMTETTPKPSMINPSTVELDDSQRTPCEVWTRVMGYHRPASSFNKGKQSEFVERVYFEETPAS